MVKSYSDLKNEAKKRRADNIDDGNYTYEELKARARGEYSTIDDEDLSYSELKERAKAENSHYTYGVDNDYINRFLDDTKSFLNTANDNYSNITPDTAESYYNSASGTSAELKSRANIIRAFLNSNKDRIDSDYYDNLLGYLDDFSSTSDTIIDSFYQESKKPNHSALDSVPFAQTKNNTPAQDNKTPEQHASESNDALKDFEGMLGYKGAKWQKEAEEDYDTSSLGNEYLSHYDDSTSYTDVQSDLEELKTERNRANHKGEDTSKYDRAIYLLQSYMNQYYDLDSTDLSPSSIQHRQDIYNDNQTEIDNLNNEIEARTNDDPENQNNYLDGVDLDDESTVSKYLNHDKDAVDFFIGYRTGRVWQDAVNQERYNTLLTAIETAANKDTVRNLQRNADNLQAENTAYRRTHPEDFLGSYNELRNEPDFTETSFSDIANSTSNDKLTLYSKYRHADYTEFNEDDDIHLINSVTSEGDLNHWGSISNSEKDIYYYLLNKEGEESAYEYLKALEPTLAKRETETDQERYVRAADSMPLRLGSFALAPLDIIGGATAFVDDTVSLVKGEEIDPYNNAHRYSNMTDAVMESDVNAVEKATNGANLGGFSAGDAYQALYSGYKSLLLTVAGNTAVASAIMSTDAAQEKATELYNRGATNEQIAEESIAAGVFEYVFEKISLDTIVEKVVAENMTKKGLSKYLATALASAGVEGTEEVNTEIANYVADQIIMRDQSERQTLIKQYKEEGYTEKEAKEKANEAFVQDLYESFMGGAVGGATSGTGLLISAGQEVAQNVSNKIEQNQFIKQVRDEAGDAIVKTGNIQTLIDTAKQSSDPDIVAQGEKLDQLYTSDNVSESKLKSKTGKLYSAIQENNANTYENAEKTERRAALAEAYGDIIRSKNDPSIPTVVAAMEKKLDGEKLTKREAKIVSNVSAQQAMERVQNNSDAISSQVSKTQERALKNLYSTAALTQTQEQEPGDVDIDDYSISKDDKTYVKGTEEAVEVGADIVGISKDSVEVKLSNGKTESVKNLDLASEDQAVAYESVLDIQKNAGVDLTPSAANMVYHVLTNSESADNVALAQRRVSIQEALEKGLSGDTVAYSADNVLTKSERQAIYDEGRRIANRNASTKQTEVNKNAKGTRREGSVSFVDGIQRSRLSTAKKTDVEFIENLSQSLGYDTVIFRSTKGSSGKYQSKFINDNNLTDESGQAPNGFWHNGKVYIDINSSNLRSEGLMLFTASHELTHMMEDYAPEHWKAYADFIVKNYVKKGVSVRSLVLQEMGRHTKLNYDQAFREVIAKSSEAMLRDTHLNEKSKAFYKENPGTWEKVKDALGRMIARLKAFYTNSKLQSTEARFVSQWDISTLEKAQDRWVKGIVSASENLSRTKNTATEGGVKFMLRDVPTSFEQNIKDVANMDSVIALTGNEFAKGDIDLVTQVSNYFTSIGGLAHSQYGDVKLTKSGVKASIGHGIGRNKAIAFKAVPSVLQDGLMIDYQKNWKQRGYNTAVIAAPITIAQTDYYMAAIVIEQADTNDYYLHEVIIKEKENATAFKTGTTKSGTPSAETSSIYSILQTIQNSNTSTRKNQSRDTDYLSAVENGDMDTAQRMVDEAAKAAGYDTTLLYHGTRKFGFTEFDLQNMDDKRSIFLTDNESVASTYSDVTGMKNIAEKIGDVDSLTPQELIAELNQYEAKYRKGKKCEYRYYSKRDIEELSEETEKQLNDLPEHIIPLAQKYSRLAVDEYNDIYYQVNSFINDLLGIINSTAEPRVRDYRAASALELLADSAGEFKSKEYSELIDSLYVLAESDYNRVGSDGIIIRIVPEGPFYNAESVQTLKEKLKSGESFGNYGLYSKMDNPLVVDGKGAEWNKIKNWAPYPDYEDVHVEEKENEYQLVDKTGKVWKEGTIEKNAYNAGIKANQIKYVMFSKAVDKIAIETERYRHTREIARYAKNHGYDGVIFKNIKDRGGFDGGLDYSDNPTSNIYVVFDSSQVKSADPVTYDDNGKVIPLSQRFDSTKKDIRYQPRDNFFDIDLFEDDDSVENIFAKEYATHHEDIGEVLKNIEDIELSSKKIDTIVNRIIRGTFGDIDAETRKTLSVELQMAMENTDNPEQISNDMIAAVRKAIDGATVTDERAEANYKDLLSVFKGNKYFLSDEQIADLAEHDMTQKEYKDRMFNKISIIKQESAERSAGGGYKNAQQLSLESLYDMLESPEEYMPYRADQWDELNYHAPIILMETLEKLRDSRTVAFSEMASVQDIDDIAVDLTAKITGAIVEAKYNSKQNPYVSKLVDKLKTQRSEAVQKQKEKAKEKLKELKQKERERAKQREQELRENFRESRAKGRENRQRAEIRNKIRNLASRFEQRLTKPKGQQYVPQQLISQTVDVLNAINIDTGRSTRLSEKIAALRNTYDGMKEDNLAYAAYDNVISTMLRNLSDDLGDTSIMDMSLSQLRETYDVLRSMDQVIRDAVRMVDTDFKKTCHQLGREMIAETAAVPKNHSGVLSGYVQSMLSAERMFNRLAGFKKDSTWHAMFEMLNNGQLHMTQLEIEFSQLFDELVTDTKNLKTLSDTKRLVDVGLKDEDGNTVKITRGMMISLYMHLLNEDNARHVLGGGLTVPGMKLYYKGDVKKAFGEGQQSVRADLEYDEYIQGLKSKIEEELTEYDIKWIEQAHEFFDVASRNALNDTTMKLYGFKKAKVNNYFPIHTDASYRAAEFESITRDMSLENSGFMKDRVKASNPILLEDIVDVVNSQIDKVSKYCGMTIPIKNFQKVYGTTTRGFETSVQKELNKKFSGSKSTQSATQYIENLITDLTVGRQTSDGFISKMMSRARGNLAQATLTLNPRVAIAQAASYPTAAAEIGWKPLMKALARGGQSNRMISRADRSEIAEITPLLWKRTQGYSNVEIGDINELRKQKHQIQGKVKKALGWIEFFDGMTVGRLYYACQYYVDEQNPNLKRGTEEYKQKVAEVYNRVIERTQPNYTIMQRPDILRNPNAIVKSLTMFMTQRLQNFNIVYDAVGTYNKYLSDYRNKINGVTYTDVKEARATLRRALVSQAVAAATIVGMKLLADALLHSMNGYRDDDELTAESISLKLLDNFADTIFGSVLFGSDIYTLIKSMTTGERYYGISMSGIDSFTEAIENITNLRKGVDVDSVNKAAKSICQLLGIPLSNAEKIGTGIYNWCQDISSGDALSFESGVERSNKQNIHRAEMAYFDGDTQKSKELIDALINEKVAQGKTEKEAKSALRSSLTSTYKPRYIEAVKNNDIETKNQIRQFLFSTGVYGSLNDLDKSLEKWLEKDK